MSNLHNERFEMIDFGKLSNEHETRTVGPTIIRDKVTGVHYLCYGGSMIVLIDENGKPVISKQEI